MSELVKDAFVGMPWYLYLILILCFGLLVASFIVPPLGIISPSVLQGAALILGFTWLLYTTANIPTFIERGAKIKASWKDASIEIGKHRKNNEEETPVEENEETEIL
jgi:hypothetical protein